MGTMPISKQSKIGFQFCLLSSEKEVLQLRAAFPSQTKELEAKKLLGSSPVIFLQV